MRIRPPVRRVWELPPLWCVLYPAGAAPVLRLRGNHMANYRGCIKWKKAKTVLAKRASEGVRKSAASGRSEGLGAGPSAGQMELGESWNYVIRGKLLSRPPPFHHQILKSSPQPVTAAPTQPNVTVTRNTARPNITKLKSTAATKSVAGKPEKEVVTSGKTVAPKPITPDLVFPTKSAISPLEGISDVLDCLPIQACVELTRRLLSTISFLQTEASRPRAVLKTVILFVAEYGSTP